MATAREAFNAAVFARDCGRCVCCSAAATEAHHVLDRKLFPDGGYHVDNGAAVCNPCHLLCEDTTLSVHEVRKAAGIARPVLPPGLDPGRRYDKWGNEMLAGGLRVAGPLASDDGCRKALSRVWHLVVEPDALPIPDWVGYSLPDAGSRRDWRAAVAALAAARAAGSLDGWLFHGTSGDAAAAVGADGMRPGKALTRVDGAQVFRKGSFWGTPLAAAWYAEDAYLKRGGSSPAILACEAAELEAAGDLVPDEATMDFPDERATGGSVDAACAAWEALEAAGRPGWRDGLAVWGAVLCLHRGALRLATAVDVSSVGDAAAFAEIAEEAERLSAKP